MLVVIHVATYDQAVGLCREYVMDVRDQKTLVTVAYGMGLNRVAIYSTRRHKGWDCNLLEDLA